ncbi:hypothetical protein B0T14DRAFT_317835 [Immersiella caudata]|uniref:Uncharacterized protein n=1 Tax=Immersiella caudata TaxID=314043 RepID=A0AA39U4S0_9PEZI|nr:hypothetical protein B0T14DRAFT_317835 [Immersiella caudata]
MMSQAYRCAATSATISSSQRRGETTVRKIATQGKTVAAKRAVAGRSGKVSANTQERTQQAEGARSTRTHNDGRGTREGAPGEGDG